MYALHPEGALGEALLPLSVSAQPVMIDGVLPMNGGMNGFLPNMVQT